MKRIDLADAASKHNTLAWRDLAARYEKRGDWMNAAVAHRKAFTTEHDASLGDILGSALSRSDRKRCIARMEA